MFASLLACVLDSFTLSQLNMFTGDQTLIPKSEPRFTDTGYLQTVKISSFHDYGLGLKGEGLETFVF